MLRRFLFLVLLLGLHATTAAQPRSSSNPAQCYDLRLGPWRGPGAIGSDSLRYAPPSRVQLDTTQADLDARWQKLRVPPRALPSVHEFATWRRSPTGDTLRLTWSTGTAGLSAQLYATDRGLDDTLQGRAKTFVDIDSAPRYTADLTAIPVDCDSPPPRTRADQRSLPTGVALADGDSVRLWTPLADVPDTDSITGKRMQHLRRQLAPPFTTAHDIDLLPDAEGRIAIIRFQLADTTDFEALISALTRAHGAPTHPSSTQHHGDLRTNLVTWANRTVRWGVHRTCRPQGTCSVGVLLVRQQYLIETPSHRQQPRQ